MDTVSQAKLASIDLQKQIKQHLEELAQATDQARRSEEMVRFLDFCGKFHQYSAMNVWLIMLACPTASMVAGFQKWKSLHRFVKKGEKAIWILAPILYKETDLKGNEVDHIYGFKTVPVFDISQTHGQPIPEAPDWKSPERNLELNTRLIKFANAKSFKIEFRELAGETQGFSTGSEITIANTAGSKTIIHEISHSLIHFGEATFYSRAIKELQAEATAFIVAKHFGIGGLNSANYIALFDLESKDFHRYMELIQKTASEIIRGVEC